MNTIPLTFSEHQISRMEIGGNAPSNQILSSMSVILLNKNGSHLRLQMLENLVSCGFRSVISVEPKAENFNLEEMTRHFPTVKFMIPQEDCTDGDIINMCMAETDARWVFVLRDSIYIPQNFMTKNLLENITRTDSWCIVPRFISAGGEGISVNVEPQAFRGRFKMVNSMLVSDKMHTLHPYDFMGIYDREKFILLGGFDWTIKSPYWQSVDLAVRSWLWGEITEITTKFAVQYTSEPAVYDVTPDIGYLRFYLKNLVPKYKIDHGAISSLSFFRFFTHSSCGLFEAAGQFREAKRWVEKCRYRFKFDAQYLIENWSTIK